MADLSNVPIAQLIAEMQRRMQCADKPDQRLILLGPPGAGTGTHAPRIKRDCCVCHLSTGHMLRAAVAAGTNMGRRAKAAMDSGNLVSDDIVVGIIKDHLSRPACKKGFILHGFPRTIEQSKALNAMLAESNLKVDKVVEMSIPDELLVERIAGRRIHSASGRRYHCKFNPPKVAGRDDVTGEPLIQRLDDHPATHAKRLAEYHRQTSPVIDFYRRIGVVETVDANQSIEKVWVHLNSILQCG